MKRVLDYSWAATFWIVMIGVAGCTDRGESEPSAAAAPASAPGGPAQHNVLSPSERAEGWRLLFDGQTTAGWRGYNADSFPERGWRAADGMLIVDPPEDGPGGGDIVTTESFGSFDLRVDFRLSPVGNSGIFYRVHEEPETAIWHHAPEYQVLDDTAYVNMGTMDMRMHLTGDNYDLHEAARRPTRAIGEWNTARIVVRGDRVEHYLNGVQTVAYELGSPDWADRVARSKFSGYPMYGRARRGPIGLQDHDHQIWFRNIKIRPLDSDSTTGDSG